MPTNWRAFPGIAWLPLLVVHYKANKLTSQHMVPEARQGCQSQLDVMLPTPPSTDPHRNDDLPPRPSTSRGRPSSAHGPGSGTCDGFPMAPGGRIPMPSMVDNDTGAQVGLTSDMRGSAFKCTAGTHVLSCSFPNSCYSKDSELAVSQHVLLPSLLQPAHAP
jgi:hypothetical protein